MNKQNTKISFTSVNAKDQGVTLMELIAVVGILSVLTSISVPSINKWVKLSKIDEAKAGINLAAVECLRGIRSGKSPASISPDTDLISNEKLSAIGYKVKDSNSDCSNFLVEPSNTNERTLYSFGFRITEDGDITKIAFPAADKSTLNSCQNWAGSNCGISPAQQQEWDRLAAIEKAKQDCNTSFYQWLNNTPPNGGVGKRNRWNSSTEKCKLVTWAFEGTIVNGIEGYKRAEEAKFGKICTAKKNTYLDNKTTSGPVVIEECGEKEHWFVEGIDQGSELLYNEKIADNAELKCLSDREKVRSNSGKDSHKGKYGPFEGPGKCGEVVWMCDGKQVTTEQAYKTQTVCGMSESQTKCGKPRFEHCKQQKWWGWWECEAWSRCMGLISSTFESLEKASKIL